jgi:hypothetical protein
MREKLLEEYRNLLAKESLVEQTLKQIEDKLQNAEGRERQQLQEQATEEAVRLRLLDESITSVLYSLTYFS